MTGFDSKQATVSVVKLATANHSPFDTRIFHKEAKTLVEAGYSVTLIVPRDDTNQSETVEDIIIIPVRHPKGGREKLFITPLRILWQALRMPRHAIMHIHDSELLMIGLVLRLLSRKVVYDAHEDTPLQISYQHWIPRWFKPIYANFYFLLEKLAGWSFQHIIVAEPIIQRYFPPHKTTLLRNFPMVAPFQAAAQHPVPRQHQVVYVGSITEVRGFREMVAACERAHQDLAFTFVLAGTFYPASLQAAIEHTNSVRYVGRVSLSELVTLNFESKVGLIIPHPVERYQTNYPVKLFEYMAAGLPVVASVFGEATAFVEECRGGLLVNPLDVEAIAGAVRYLLTHEAEATAMGQRGQQMVFDRYNWEAERQKLLALYAQLAS